MRFTKFLFPLLLLCSPCFASWSKNGQCQGGQTGAGTSISCSATLTVTNGDIILCTVSLSNNANVTSFSGTGATWSVATNAFAYNSTDSQGIAGGYGVVTATGTVTPTANFASQSFIGIQCADFTSTTGVAASPLDGAVASAAGTGTSTNGRSSGSITTTVNGDLLFGGIIDATGTGGTATAGTLSVSFAGIETQTASGNYMNIEDGTQATAAAGTVADWTFSNSDGSAQNLIAIKPSSGGAAKTCTFGLMHVGSC